MCSRLLLLAVTFSVALVLRRSPLTLWHTWDAKWYLGIAAHGYSWSLYGGQSGHSSLAFFPLYPLLVHIADLSGLPSMVGAMILSNAAFLAALFYLYRLTVLEWRDKQAASRAIWLLGLFPTAMFTFAPYTEGLFLLCAVAALYHALARQSLAAGVWVAAGLLTRSTGLALFPAVIAVLGPQRLRTWIQSVGPSALAVMAYLATLSAQGISVSRLFTAQRTWHRAITFPWTGFTSSLYELVFHRPANIGQVAENALQLGVTCLFLVLTVLAWRDLRHSMLVYCVGFWAIVLCSPQWLDGYFAPFSSVDRFVLALFPLAVWAAHRLHSTSFRYLIAVLAVLMAGTATVHIAGGWVG
ncbi:MAG TPA: mannosyltransferase family protein [Chloroflexota bacterium]